MFEGIIPRKVILLFFLVQIFLLGGCTSVPKEDEPEYNIVGTWGMVSGFHQYPNGTSVVYDKLREGMYYTRYEFKENGTLIQTQYLGIKLFGRYEYDNTTLTLTFGWEPFKEMYTGSVVFDSENEITITTEGPLGILTQVFKRILAPDADLSGASGIFPSTPAS